MMKSYPAQVGAVFDSTGKIHPQWLKFKDDYGEIITVREFSIDGENAESDRCHRNFICTAIIFDQMNRFCLSYNVDSHSWTIELRDNERDYRYLVSHDRSEFR